MNLKQWYLKNFKRNEIIQLIYTGEDKRVISVYVIPQGDIIRYKDNDFLLIPSLVYNQGGIPTVYANHKTAELINIYDTPTSEYKPNALNLANTANVAEQLYRASGKSTLDSLVPVLLVGVIAVMGYFMYTTGNNFNTLLERITELETILGG